MTGAKDIYREYEQRDGHFRERENYWSAFSSRLAWVRFITAVLFLFCIVLFIRSGVNFWIPAAIVFLAIFIFLVKYHDRVDWQKRLASALGQINREEIAFLKGQFQFDGGGFLNPEKHLYAVDLDVFGKNSIYAYLNRTVTIQGAQKLGGVLSHKENKENILKNQEAIRELSNLVDLRQEVRALGWMQQDSEAYLQFLWKWIKEDHKLDKTTILLIYLIPGFLLLSVLLFIITGQMIWLKVFTFFLIFNLMVFGRYFKWIKNMLSGTEQWHAVIKHYGLMMEKLEAVSFQSAELKKIHVDLSSTGAGASRELQKLSHYFHKMDSVYNAMAVLFFTGTVNYHLHLLHRIYRWKFLYGKYLPQWLDALARFEMFSSLANFRYNNPGYVFPEISDQPEWKCKEMGHPLIGEAERVCNDFSLDKHSFVILTGSNMSGKSTFLRSVGVNQILANAGSVICARTARLFPFQILVSMRVSDNLAEHASYFYTEVQRLFEITTKLGEEPSLVLLDEILRGTNSDDKRQGTLEVIRRMVRERAFGIIATHDLEICQETDRQPNVLTNKCFEVEIVDNELFFDYRLRDGICQNQSATFLMKKYGIF